MTDKMEHIETEVKFFITEPMRLREKIISLGALSGGNIFETNIIFEDKDKNLIKHKSLLRLRKNSKTTLTFKSPAPDADSRFKMLRELEVEVSDFPTATRILESLGFIKEQIYEKWRETLVLGSTYFCIDKIPYGDFLEIEGNKEEIMEYASLLGLDWKERILLNYLELFDILKRSLDLSFSDITFENFKNVGADFSKYFYTVKADRIPMDS
ncbi:MAG: class IV adenylate cyclase [Proteobacteria bacterium]|nr:class IV adenylate cyclase [Pseudomonadota bacterium]